MKGILRKQLISSSLLVIFSLSSLVEASTVQVTGSFANPTASDMYFFNRIYNQDNDASPSQQISGNAGSSSDSIAYFGWGIDAYDTFINQELIQSHFWFNGTGSVDGSTNTSITLNDAFSLGSFTYTNEQTILSGGLVEIDFQMDIMFDGLSLSPSNYTIGIDNTVNTSGSADDTATLLSNPADMLFTKDGLQYMLSFNGFSRDAGLSFETSATLPEGQQTTAQIYATITAVPLPAAAWLFGSGILCLVGLARRKKTPR
jgi:hypothetical protein